ncbi:MAG: epimerase [Flavobacteriales bacterium]|nr:epimerase [Flavobacteriales bacterium]|tara:strand:+ start:350 stop:1768 length:1419 start_codon:yes stop_codon:yes gene_type:complete
MKILLTGATGYIGKRILPILVQKGHHVVCCVRDTTRFNPPDSLKENITVIEADLLDENSLTIIPSDIDIAYYLVHSMTSSENYKLLEKKSAQNFRVKLSETKVKHVIYLSGITNEKNLSKHLLSRKEVETELSKGSYNLTTFRAGIIVGSGSASFEIIRDLVEKLPVMITPKWLLTKCQPIGVSDVLKFLTNAILKEEIYNKNYDIGSDDVLTYKEMLLQFAEIRNLNRRIWTVPLMTPKLSSYWLYFVTSTSYKLARSLVESMKVEVVCRNNEINKILNIQPISYKEALLKAFQKIQNNLIVSSWKDSYSSSESNFNISEFINVPKYGCFIDKRIMAVENSKLTTEKIWSIGGMNGWYYGNWLWRIRGFIDKIFGGVGLRRGRTNKSIISVGDSLDFWRVLYANKREPRLLLFAEMKLPGEAWLEFKIVDNKLIQTATFRPVGLGGRLYWLLVYPFHGVIFQGLIKKLSIQ